MAGGHAGTAGPQQQARGQRDEHQHHEGHGDLDGVDRGARDEDRQDQRHISHGDHHQQHHQAHREGHVGLRELGELDQERCAGREPAQQQPDPERIVEVEHLPQPERGQRRQHEAGGEGQCHHPNILERGQNLSDGQAQPDRESARDNEEDNGDIRTLQEEIVHAGPHQLIVTRLRQKDFQAVTGAEQCREMGRVDQHDVPGAVTGGRHVEPVR